MAADESDERQPLLRTNTAERHLHEERRASTVFLNDDGEVDFDPSGDADNPQDWPSAFKWGIVTLMAFTAFTVTFTCISVVPIATRISRDLTPSNGTGPGSGDRRASILLVTIWELGEAAGPLFIAPLSEHYGRYPVINGAGVLFVAATLLAAMSPSIGVFVAARCLTGLAVATNVLGPAVVGDMFVAEQRGAAMSILLLAPLLGGAVGPAISGALEQTVGWRQVLLIAAGLAAACEALFLTFFKETYRVPILRRKAAALRDEEHDTALKCTYEHEESRTILRLWEAVTRPIYVLFGSGVLMTLSLFGSVVFSYFYVLAVSLAEILEGIYDLPPALTGTAFMCFSLGSFVSIFICNVGLDSIYVKLRNANKGVGKPEFRLPLSIFGAFTMPISIALYGWAAQLHLPLPILLLSVAMIGFTLLLSFLPLIAYVVDAFGILSASAMTGVIVTRCLMSTFLPLATAPLVDRFGWGWGLSLFSAVSLVLAPIPVFIMRYGDRWRQRSKYTKEV